MGAVPGAVRQGFWWVDVDRLSFGSSYPSALPRRGDWQAGLARLARVALGVEWPFWRDPRLSIWLVAPGFRPWRKRSG